MIITGRYLISWVGLWWLSGQGAQSFVLLSAELKKQQAGSTSTVPAATTVAPAILQDPGTRAYPQQPPHAGCHFRPSHPATSLNHRGPRKSKRFFEGWYYRITLPEDQASFAFIYSIEDPFDGSDLSLSCQQIMGPDDEYLVQADPDHTKFWAWYHQQALGCVFVGHDDNGNDAAGKTTSIDPDTFFDKVESGFQMMPNRLQGRLVGHDGSKGGVLEGQGKPGECMYDMTISPVVGWGDEEVGQKSTAGWLASYKVFEPHWQVRRGEHDYMKLSIPILKTSFPFIFAGDHGRWSRDRLSHVER